MTYIEVQKWSTCCCLYSWTFLRGFGTRTVTFGAMLNSSVNVRGLARSFYTAQAKSVRNVYTLHLSLFLSIFITLFSIYVPLQDRFFLTENMNGTIHRGDKWLDQGEIKLIGEFFRIHKGPGSGTKFHQEGQNNLPGTRYQVCYRGVFLAFRVWIFLFKIAQNRFVRHIGLNKSFKIQRPKCGKLSALLSVFRNRNRCFQIKLNWFKRFHDVHTTFCFSFKTVRSCWNSLVRLTLANAFETLWNCSEGSPKVKSDRSE